MQEFRLVLSAAGIVTVTRRTRGVSAAGIVTVTRRTRGDDIAAACGQLAGEVDNRVRVSLGSRIPEATWIS